VTLFNKILCTFARKGSLLTIKQIKLMKKKQYLRPSVEVFELNHQQQLLAGSLTSERDDYGDPIDDTWSVREMIDFDEENAFME
jgi:hypothetical protein